jgi:hypothetical protein
VVPKGYLDIKGTVKATGLRASVIRMWETRHGWPQPRRLDNGHRIYSEELIADLISARDIVKTGVSISKLIDKDGNLNIPRKAKPPKRPQLRLAHLVPKPESSSALRVREDLMEGFHNQDPGKVLMAIASVLTLHPRDRSAACFAPACAALVDLEVEKKGIMKHDQIVSALAATMGGQAVLKETMETFLQFIVIKHEASQA